MIQILPNGLAMRFVNSVDLNALEDLLMASVADLAKILGAAEHLLKLVNEILDLSKIEAGRMQLDLQVTALADLLNGIVLEAEAAATKTGNKILSSIRVGPHNQ